jgi:choline kinase
MNMPKCLVQVDGHALIDYQLDLLRDVPNVQVVVGFMEEEVIGYVRQKRPDVVFVRNPEFHCTSNSHSVFLASRHFKEPFLIVDGDLLIKKSEFETILAEGQRDGSWIGVTPQKSEEPVFARLDDQDRIDLFSFTEKTPWEWCGVALVPPNVISSNKKYVFEELKKILPSRAAKMTVYEIDTPQDFTAAVEHLPELGYKFEEAA